MTAIEWGLLVHVVQQLPVPNSLCDRLGLGRILWSAKVSKAYEMRQEKKLITLLIIKILFLLNCNFLCLCLLHWDVFLNWDFLRLSVASPQVDGEVDELTVLLGNGLQV